MTRLAIDAEIADLLAALAGRLKSIVSDFCNVPQVFFSSR